MKNKGVSSIIATILILLIAISLIGTAYIYFSGIMAGKTKNTISITDLTCNSTGYITVTLSNDGTANLLDADIAVLIDSQARSDNFDFGTIAPHTSVTALSTTPETLGVEHTILVSSPSNSVRQNIQC